jgi:DNA-binding NtrC family response regulator
MNENGSKPTVVVVDDEQMVVTSLTALLGLEDEFEVHGFTDPEEAEQFVESHTADAIVSDYRMPKMNGLQLLRRVREVQPESSRVLLTSHADAQSAIDAINQLALFQYLEKPWDNEQLLLAIRSGVERSHLIRDLRQKADALDSAHTSLKNAQKRLVHAFL